MPRVLGVLDTEVAVVVAEPGGQHQFAARCVPVLGCYADTVEFFGRTVTLKVKYADFEQITRSKTPGGFVGEFGMFWQTAQELLSAVDYSEKKIRLMGLTVSNAQDLETPEVYQLEFDFGDS